MGKLGNLPREGQEPGYLWRFRRQEVLDSLSAQLWDNGCQPDFQCLGHIIQDSYLRGFPGGALVKNLPASAGDTGSSPGPGRSHMPRSN